MQSENPAFMELVSPSKVKQYSEEERHNHCKEWKKSGLSMSQYCQSANIAVSTLSKWINENKIPLRKKPHTAAADLAYQAVEIILLNGIRLRFSRISQVDLIKTIEALA